MAADWQLQCCSSTWRRHDAQRHLAPGAPTSIAETASQQCCQPCVGHGRTATTTCDCSLSLPSSTCTSNYSISWSMSMLSFERNFFHFYLFTLVRFSLEHCILWWKSACWYRENSAWYLSHIVKMRLFKEQIKFKYWKVLSYFIFSYY